jgi:homoserine dehydrogenase
MIAARLDETSLLDIAKRLRPADIKPMSEWVGEYYFRFGVVDRPGVLAQIAGILGEHNISITSVYQPERDEGGQVPVVVMSHEAQEKNVINALTKIESLETVLDKPVLIRVEKE